LSPDRQTGSGEPDAERPDGRRRPLTLPTLKIIRLEILSEQVAEWHEHQLFDLLTP